MLVRRHRDCAHSDGLNAQLTAVNFIVENGVYRDENPLRRIIKVDPIARHRWIIAVALKIALRVLESTGRVDLIGDAQEQRSGIRR